GPGSAIIDAGEGSNNVYVNGVGNRQITSGSGTDYIYWSGGYEYTSGVLNGSVSSGGGDDSINLQNFVLYNYGSTSEVMVIDAGAGNDAIYAPWSYASYYGMGPAGSLSINAGDGNDTLSFGYSYYNYGFTSASVSLGTGADSVIIDGWNGGQVLTISDF